MAVRGDGSALRASTSRPEALIATGTPVPSIVACAGSRRRSGSTWYIALIDVRVVPSVSAMSRMRAVETATSRATDAPPETPSTTSMTTLTASRTTGLAEIPRRRPYRRISGPATRTRNAMLTTFITAV